MNRKAALFALAMFGAIAMPAKADTDRDFATALVATERSPEIRADEDIYAPLLGVWDVEARDQAADGSFTTSRGEWLFARTLEGRAVQDVWIDPVRTARRPSASRFANRYGTSVRTFDPSTRRWQVTWLNPVSGAFDVLYARRDGARIVQEGVRPDGQRMRWTFQDITASSFRWTGEGQAADGSWRLEAEFFGRRRS